MEGSILVDPGRTAPVIRGERQERLAPTRDVLLAGEPSDLDHGVSTRSEMASPIDAYLARYSMPGSRKSMASALKTVVRITEPGRRASALAWSSPEHSAALRRHLVERSGLAVGTTNRALASVRGVARAGVEVGLIDPAMYDQIRRAARGVTELPCVVPALDAAMQAQIDALIPTTDTSRHARRDGPMVALLRRGLGSSALVGLDLADYDTRTPALVVRCLGRRPRRVIIDGVTASLIDDWLAVRGFHAGPLFVGVHRTGRLHRRRLHAGTVRDILRRRSTARGIRPPLRPGEIRRRAIATLVEVYGADAARRLLGLSRRRSLPVPAPTGAQGASR